MSSSALRVLTEGHTELPMPPYLFGVVTLLIFAVLLGVLWTFRNSSQKYAPPSEHGQDEAAGQGAVHHH